MIVHHDCPNCGGPVPVKPPHLPSTQPIYCSRKCMKAANRRRSRRRTQLLAATPDAVLVRMSHDELAEYGVDVACGRKGGRPPEQSC